MSSICMGSLSLSIESASVGRRFRDYQTLDEYSSITEYTAPLLELVLVDLAASKALLENVEGRATRRWRLLPRPTGPADEKDHNGDHRSKHQNHKQRTEYHAVPSSTPHHMRPIGVSVDVGGRLRPRRAMHEGQSAHRHGSPLDQGSWHWLASILDHPAIIPIVRAVWNFAQDQES